MVRVGPNKYEDALEQPHVLPMNGYVFAAPSGEKRVITEALGSGQRSICADVAAQIVKGKTICSRTVPTGKTLRTPINIETRRVK